MCNSKLKFTEFKDLLSKGYLKTTQKCILEFMGFCFEQLILLLLALRSTSQGVREISDGRLLKNLVVLFNALCLQIIRSSHRRCSLRKGIFRTFAKFTIRQLCQGLFFKSQVFSFLQNTFLQDTSGGLFLYLQYFGKLKKQNFLQMLLQTPTEHQHTDAATRGVL